MDVVGHTLVTLVSEGIASSSTNTLDPCSASSLVLKIGVPACRPVRLLDGVWGSRVDLLDPRADGVQLVVEAGQLVSSFLNSAWDWGYGCSCVCWDMNHLPPSPAFRH